MNPYDTADVTSSAPSIAYRVEGNGGTPVILVMGLGMRGAAWRPQIGPLAEKHKVVFFDHRGIGNSAPLDETSKRFSIRTLAGDVLRLMDHLEIERAHLVGVSLGGMVAQETALAAQPRFSSLTLMATHAGGRTAGVPMLRGMKFFLKSMGRDRERRLAALAQLLYPEHFLQTTDRDALDERMRDSFGRRPEKTVLRRQVLAVAGHDTAARLAKLELPTMVILPELDILVRPSSCRRLAGLIPGARLMRLPDAGHGLIFQSAEQINTWLLDHFRAAEAS